MSIAVFPILKIFFIGQSMPEKIFLEKNKDFGLS